MHVSRSDSLLQELRPAVKCRVVGPDDAAYDEVRTVYAGAFDRRPAAIVRPRTAEDVAGAITFAARHGLEVAVRSGGHSVAGHSATEGGIVVDLREINGIEVDAETRTAWAGTGVSAGEYTTKVGAVGLATGFGDAPSVGIGGITLGGGVGYLSRRYGLTIDSLLAAEIVTAGGEVIHTDEASHPDLFWAIRGGGGNFGVATRFKFRLHPVRHVIGGMLLLPATADVVADFVAAADAAPEELTTIANVMPAPPMPFVPAEHRGKLVLLAFMCYSGDLAAGDQVLAPFRSLTTPIADLLRPMRYPEVYPPDDDAVHPAAVARGLFAQSVARSSAEAIIEGLRAPDAPVGVAQIRVLGGAVARVPAEATAYAHRTSRIMMVAAAFYNSREERASREAWVARFARDLNQGETGAYVNFLGDEGPERVREAYPGATWERLAAIKARYDPTNLFRLNQNVPPAAETTA